MIGLRLVVVICLRCLSWQWGIVQGVKGAFWIGMESEWLKCCLLLVRCKSCIFGVNDGDVCGVSLGSRERFAKRIER